MTEIKTLDEKELNLKQLSPAERAQFFETLKNTTGDDIYDKIAVMFERYIRSEVMSIKPSIKELLVSSIFDRAKHLPIKLIPDIHHPLEQKFVGSKIVRRFGGDEQTTKPSSSGNSKYAELFKKAKIDENQYVKIKFTEPIRCNIVNESPISSIIITPNTEVQIKSITMEFDDDIANIDTIVAGNYDLKNIIWPQYQFSTARMPIVFKIDDFARLWDIVAQWRVDYAYMVMTQYMLAQHEPIKTKLDKIHKVKPPIYEKLQKFESSELMAEIEKITESSITGADPIAELSRLFIVGFTYPYILAQLLGKDDKTVRAAIENQVMRIKRRNFYETNKQKLIEQANIINVISNIVRDRLGEAKFQLFEKNLKKNPSLRTNAMSTLSLLAANEKSIIENEYKKQADYLKQLSNNKCPHLGVLAQIRKGIDKNLLTELESFMKSTTKLGDNYIKCEKCGFNLICPHRYEQLRDEVNSKSYKEIRATLNKYIGGAPIRDNFYCKICSEIISTIDTFDYGVGDEIKVMDEELKDLMRGEFMGLLRFVKTSGAMLSAFAIINSMIETCYPFVYEMERQIMKSKTQSVDEIKSKMSLYITIYGFVYLIHVIYQQSTSKDKAGVKLEFRDFNMTEKPEKLLAAMIMYAFNTIANIKNIALRNIPDMTIESIKGKLVEAYRVLARERVVISTTEKQRNQYDILDYLLCDPMYRYFVDISHKAHNSYIKDANEYTNVQKYLGQDLKVIQKATNMFEKAVYPNLGAWLKGGNTNAAKFKQVIAENLASLHEYDKTQLQSLFKPFLDYTKGEYTQEYKKILDKFTAPQPVIQKLLNDKKIIKPYYTFRKDSTMKVVRTNVPISRIYDEKGEPHVWNTVIVKEGAEFKEYQSGKIPVGTTPGQIVDIVCGKCKAKQSEVGKLDSNKILLAVTEKNRQRNVLKYYENRCPEGGMHEMTGGVCGKCAYGKLNGAEYFAKYKKHFDKERSVEDIKSDIEYERPVDTKVLVDKYYGSWKYDFSTVIKLSTLIGVPQAQITLLGVSEGRDFSEIKSGSYIPPEPKTKNETRGFVLLNYTNTLVRTYNTIRYLYRIPKPPAYINLLMTESGVDRDKYSTLEQLPQLFEPGEINIVEKISLFQHERKPREFNEFCLQSFCELCIKIYEFTVMPTLCKNFVKMFVKRILLQEEMTTRPGYFNWSQAYGDPNSVTATKSDDVNYEEDPENDEEGDAEEREKEEEEEKVTAFKGLEEFDVDKEENEGHEEDDGINLRVQDRELD